MVRLSQILSINLMVDLNNVDYRRRRMRQLSNFLILREGGDHEESYSSSLGDTIQSDSVVYREVRTTMAIGGQLNVNFLP